MLCTGAIAWFRGPRDFDSAIAIRTAIARDGELTYHVGAGIVADSDPEAEWQESVNKARAVLRAVEMARTATPGDAGEATDRVARRAEGT